MKARVTRFHSPDLPDLRNDRPRDMDFGVLLQVFVGTTDSEGEDSFDVQVCTLPWFARRHATTDVVGGWQHIFVRRWDWDTLENFIVRHVESFEAESWVELAAHIGRLGRWEFEGYVDR